MILYAQCASSFYLFCFLSFIIAVVLLTAQTWFRILIYVRFRTTYVYKQMKIFFVSMLCCWFEFCVSVYHDIVEVRSIRLWVVVVLVFVAAIVILHQRKRWRKPVRTLKTLFSACSIILFLQNINIFTCEITHILFCTFIAICKRQRRFCKAHLNTFTYIVCVLCQQLWLICR